MVTSNARTIPMSELIIITVLRYPGAIIALGDSSLYPFFVRVREVAFL